MRKHLSRKPHNVSENVWWYEENKGICLVIRFLSNTEQHYIPWREIRHALKRKDKKE